MKYLSYRKKILFSSMIVGITPIMILCALYIVTSTIKIKEEIQINMQQSTDKMSEAIDNELDNMKRIMKSILADDRIYDALITSQGKTKGDEIQDYLYIKNMLNIYQNDHHIDRIRILLNFDTIYKDENVNFFDFSFWETGKEVESSGWNMGYRFAFPYEGEEILFSYYTSVYSYKDSKVASIVLVDLREEKMFKLIYELRAFQNESIVFMVDSELNIISAFEKKMIGEKLNEYYNLPLSALSTGFFENENYIISISKTNNADVYVIELTSRSSEKEEIINLLILSTIVGILATVIAFVISMQISGNLSKRMLKLADSIDNHTEYKDIVEKGNKDELTTVITAYNRMLKNEERLQKQIVESKIMEERAKLKALQSQIKPHFLYNTLAGIRGAIALGKYEEAYGMIGNLARFFQLALSHGDEKIPIADEMEMIEKYLELMSIIYPGQFQWKINVDEAIKPFLIAKFTLQPLVENAIQHGIRPKGENGILTITGSFEDDDISIYIMDNGIGIDEKRLQGLQNSLSSGENRQGAGYGIKNVHSRLRMFYGMRYGLTINRAEIEGIVVKVLIPQDV